MSNIYKKKKKKKNRQKRYPLNLFQGQNIFEILNIRKIIKLKIYSEHNNLVFLMNSLTSVDLIIRIQRRIEFFFL